MKYLFCDDLSDKHSDESREHWAETAFISEEAPADWKSDVEKTEKELAKIRSGKDWREYLPVFQKATLYIGIFLALAFVYDIYVDGVDLLEVIRRHPLFFWGALCAFALSGISYLLGRSQAETSGSIKKTQAAMDRIDAAEQELSKYFRVPRNAARADILQFTYEEKDDKPNILFVAEYREVSMFARDDALCIFDGKNIYSFPKSEMTGIRLIEKEIAVSNWNKSGEQESSNYTMYGVRPQFGLRYYCLLDIERGGEKYGLPFPAYELDVITGLTGLPSPKKYSTSKKKKGKR